jgi:hypothetical protein
MSELRLSAGERLHANPKPVKRQAANSEIAIGYSPNNTGPWPK